MANWKAVVGFEGVYEVSDHGHVARVATHGRKPKPIWRLLKMDTKPNGYVYVDLSRDNQPQRHYVHQLVWCAFKGPIPNGLEPNHKNGLKNDNRLGNFKLVTRSENMLHSFQSLNPSLNRSQGAAHHKAKLSESDVKHILRLAKSGASRREIAEMFDVSKTAVGYIVNGRNWKSVTGLRQA